MAIRNYCILVCAILCLGTATAQVPLSGYNLKVIQVVVNAKVIEQISAELNASQLALEPLKASITACKAQINTTVEACSKCIIEACKTKIAECKAAGQGGASIDQILLALTNIGLGEVGSGLTTFGNIIQTNIGDPVVNLGQIALQQGMNLVNLPSSFTVDTNWLVQIDDLTSQFGNLAKDLTLQLGNILGDTALNIAGDMESWLKKMGGIFTGRRRRSTAAPTCASIKLTNGSSCIAYNATCTPCQPLLSTDTKVIMSNVCGNPIVDTINTFNALLTKTLKVFNVYKTKVENQTLVNAVTYNPAMYDPVRMAFTGIQINGLPSAAGLNFGDMTATAMEIATEMYDTLML